MSALSHPEVSGPRVLFTEPFEHPATVKFRSPEVEKGDPTLQQCFDRFEAIELRGRSPETVSEYHTHLRRWHEFWDQQRLEFDARKLPGEEWKYRTSYPVLPEIGRKELLAFDAWCQGNLTNKRGEPLSNRVINKHIGTVTSILNWAVKHELIEAVPKIERRKERKSARKLHLDLEEADLLKRACHVARWPDCLEHPAALYWEALVVGWTVQGFRTQEQVKYESRHRSLHWDDVHWDPETPHPDGKARHSSGWLVYRPDKNWDSEDPPLVLPMHAAYREHLVAIRGDCRRVFPFPLNNRYFYDQWDAIVREAGIEPKKGWRGEAAKYQIKHLRKTAVKWVNDDEARRILGRLLGETEGKSDDLLSSKAIGHTEAVSRQNYDSDEERLVMAYQSLRVPDSFRYPLTGGRRQMVLF